MCVREYVIYIIPHFLASPPFLTPPALRLLILLPLTLSASPLYGHAPAYDLVLPSFLNA